MQPVGTRMYKNILLAYGGSRERVLALREGAQLARTCGAKVVLLSVIPNTAGSAELAEGVGGALSEQIDGARDLLKQAEVWVTQRGVEPTAQLVSGDPAAP